MKLFFSLAVTILLSGFSFSFAFAQEILTWQDCLREAQENHPDLISARERLNQAKANKAIVVSGVLPHLSSEVSRSASQNRSDSYSYGITGRQLLFDGFKSSYQISSAQENIKSFQYRYKVVSSELRARLRFAFVELLKAQELLEISQGIAQRREQNKELVQLRYEAGREHKGALLAAQASLTQAEFEVAQSLRNIALAQRRLSKEIGRDFMPFKVKGDFKLGNTGKKPEFEDLAEGHPLGQEFAARREAALFDLKSTRADFSPRLQANAGIKRSAFSWPPRDDEWQTSLVLSFPIFEGGSRIHRVSEAESRLNQIQADKRSVLDDLALGLEQAWQSLQDAVERIEVERKFVEAAQARAKIAQAQYSTGLISFDNWIIIEDDLVRAKKSFLEAQANSLIAESRWVLAKGEALHE